MCEELRPDATEIAQDAAIDQKGADSIAGAIDLVKKMVAVTLDAFTFRSKIQ